MILKVILPICYLLGGMGVEQQPGEKYGILQRTKCDSGNHSLAILICC